MLRFLRVAAVLFTATLLATCKDANPVAVDTNHSPSVQAVSLTVEEDSSGVADVMASAQDADGDVLMLKAWDQGRHGAVSRDGGGLRYTPEPDFNGEDAFGFTVADGNGGEAKDSVMVTVLAVNDAPVAVDDSMRTVEDTSVLVEVLANDVDVDGDSLWVSGFTASSNGSVSQEGDALLYTPAAYFNGADSFTYVVSDGTAADTAAVHIEVASVNDPPVGADDSATVAEDDSVLIDVLANDTDPDDTVLNVAEGTPPAHGAVTLEGNQFRYTPAPDYNGLDSFTYLVSDTALADTATVFLSVTPVNDAPVAEPDSATVEEDGTVLVDVLADDSDIDGDSLSVTSFTQASHGAVAQVGTELRYTPAAGYYGTDSFGYTVSDGQGGTDTATVTVRVNAPPVAVADTASIAQNGAVVLAVLTNDSDPDGDSLSVISFTQGANGVVTQEGDALRYTPATDYYGTDGFGYTVADGYGGQDSATVTVSVLRPNQPPLAVNDTASAFANGTVLIPVLANDTDADGDTLTVTQYDQVTMNIARVTQEGDALLYTPRAGMTGVDQFRYWVGDGHGGTSQAWVYVTVKPADNAPVAVADSATIGVDGNVLIAVLFNDSDPDGDSLSVASFTQGANGTVTREGEALRYTPASGYSGTDSFGYVASDGRGLTDTASVTVTVSAGWVNHAPVAVADSTVIQLGGNGLVSVLANDTDIDGDALTITAFTQGANGVVTQEGDALRYTQVSSGTGTDSFSYAISDGQGGQDSATVTVSVNAPPLAVNDTASVFANGTVLIPVLANDTDADGDTLTVTQYDQLTMNIARVTQEGDALRYTPSVGITGVDQFRYWVGDGHGGTSQAWVYVTVKPADNAPVAVDDSVSVTADSSVLIDVLANDTDADGDSLTVTSVTGAGHGATTLEGNQVRFTPDSGYVGLDQFTYTVTDGTLTATGQVTVNVVAGALAMITVTPDSGTAVANGTQ